MAQTLGTRVRNTALGIAALSPLFLTTSCDMAKGSDSGYSATAQAVDDARAAHVNTSYDGTSSENAGESPLRRDGYASGASVSGGEPNQYRVSVLKLPNGEKGNNHLRGYNVVDINGDGDIDFISAPQHNGDEEIVYLSPEHSTSFEANGYSNGGNVTFLTERRMDSFNSELRHEFP